MTWTWNGAVSPQCRGTVSGMRLTWAWRWPQTGNPHSWCECCPSWPCPSPWTPASWLGAGCTPGWSGPAGCRVVCLACWSAAPASQKTGDSGCSPSELGLRRGEQDGNWLLFLAWKPFMLVLILKDWRETDTTNCPNLGHLHTHKWGYLAGAPCHW